MALSRVGAALAAVGLLGLAGCYVGPGYYGVYGPAYYSSPYYAHGYYGGGYFAGGYYAGGFGFRPGYYRPGNYPWRPGSHFYPHGPWGGPRR